MNTSDVQVFRFAGDTEIRTTIIDGKPYFVASDVANALGYVDIKQAISKRCTKGGSFCPPPLRRLAEYKNYE